MDAEPDPYPTGADDVPAAAPGLREPDVSAPEEDVEPDDASRQDEANEWEAGPAVRPPTCQRPLVHTPLPTSGLGFYTYRTADRRFGMSETVQAVLATLAGWAVAHPRGPRIGIGDLSLRCGRAMAGHTLHRRGLDVDIRPVRADGLEGPISYAQPGYSQALTQDLVNRLHANRRLRVQYILFNDPRIKGVTPWFYHHDHLHVRFFPPAGVTPALEIPDLAGEFELAKRGPVSASLSWQECVIKSYPPANIPTGGGLYIVQQGSMPIYVGETESFKKRWNGRLQSAHQIGLVPDHPVAVWFGTDDPRALNTGKDVRKAIEHAIIRTLISRGAVPENKLRNRSSFKEFNVQARLRIAGFLPKPMKSMGFVNVPEYDAKNNILDINGARKTYELSTREWGQEMALE